MSPVLELLVWVVVAILAPVALLLLPLALAALLALLHAASLALAAPVVLLWDRARRLLRRRSTGGR